MQLLGVHSAAHAAHHRHSCTTHLTHFPGFHNSSLYPTLRPAVPPLVGLLADEEDRTRANAAGALGNLVRNSAQLCGDIMVAGALQVRGNRGSMHVAGGQARPFLLHAAGMGAAWTDSRIC